MRGACRVRPASCCPATNPKRPAESNPTSREPAFDPHQLTLRQTVAMPQYSPPDRYAMNLNSPAPLIRHTIVLSMLAALTVAFGIGQPPPNFSCAQH